MADFLDEDLQRLASLVAHGLSDEQICDAMAIAPQTLKLAKDEEVFKLALSAKKVEYYEKQIVANSGWDAIEETGISKVLEAFKWNTDPVFALKAAETANKMLRRTPNGKQNAPIDASAVGNVVMIQLNQRFVSGLDGMLDVTAHKSKPLPPKRQTDMPTPKQVQSLLLEDQRIEEESLNMDGLELAFAENV